ncbi:MAG: aspartate carbamoyltransferase regulatory subunit [Gammaproteobacteria bacterium RIFCSPHIGHO2_12_FULL_42_10]|nr:MAG: aspartate carbamoyltransferase regulatory subunit [Gammaproteobacteria bacterium RIFCSPHIGHO2_12_FULL_42_10]
MSETLSVTAIKNGTVIDHIDPGQALRIIHLLSLNISADQITIGLNLISKSMNRKDLIKIETRVLSNQEANDIVVFSPHATINVIQNFKVTNKIKTRLPETMRSHFLCPNPTCITHGENIESLFFIALQNKKIRLICHYCENQFDRDQVRVKI